MDMDTAQTNASNNNVDLSGLLNSLPSSVGSMLKAGGNVAQKKADIDVQSQDALAQKTTPINQAYEQQIQKQGATQEKIAGQLGQPFQVPQETVSDYGQLGGIVAMLGVMLGKSGKQSATNVLAAIDGTLKGYQQGRKDMIATAQKEFDTNMKRLQAEAQNAAAMLENATKLRAVNLDKANQEVAQLKAHALQGIASSDYIVQNADKAMQLAVSLKNSATSAGQLALQVQKLNNEIVAQDPQGLYTRNPKTGELQLVPGSAGKQKFGASIVDANKAGEAPLIVKQFTGAVLPAKEAQEVISIANAVGQAEALKEEIIAKPDLIGRSGQLGQIINRTVDSFRNGQDYNDPDASQEQLIFAKKYAAYLVNYERSLVGGARGFTVSFQNRFNKLLEQNQFNKVGFANLMDQQITELANQATPKSRSITRQNILEMGRDFTGRSTIGAPSASSAVPSTTSSGNEKEKAIAAFGSYEPEKYEYGTNPTTGKFARRKK